MDLWWETSDAYHDARTSSTSEKLKDHLKELADKPVTCIDNDYLNFHRLLADQYAIYKPRRLKDNQSVEQQTPITSGNPDPPEGDQRPKSRTVNDLPNDDGDGMREKRNQHTEIDRENSILVANTLPHERNIPGNENGELNIVRDVVVPPLIVNVRRRVRRRMND